jgi:hypothetical protein
LKWFVITAKKKFKYEKEKFTSKKEAEKYYKKQKKKHKKVTLYKHKDFKKPDRRIIYTWCPICGKNRKFKTHPEKKVKVCPYCGISEDFYYVKKYNWL